MGAKRNVYRILVEKLEGKRPLGRPRRRLVYNIKIYLRDLELDGMGCIYLAQDKGPVEGSCEHSDEPSGSLKCWELLEYLHNWELFKKVSAP
jgi:hypothetical protein